MTEQLPTMFYKPLENNSQVPEVVNYYCNHPEQFTYSTISDLLQGTFRGHPINAEDTLIDIAYLNWECCKTMGRYRANILRTKNIDSDSLQGFWNINSSFMQRLITAARFHQDNIVGKKLRQQNTPNSRSSHSSV